MNQATKVINFMKKLQVIEFITESFLNEEKNRDNFDVQNFFSFAKEGT